MVLFGEPYESTTDLVACHIASKETVPAGTHVHAPHPSDCFALLHFRSAGRVAIEEHHQGVHGSGCVLLPPGVWWEFSGDELALGYDRIDIRGPRAEGIVARSELPVCRPFFPGIFQLFGDMVGSIAMERLSAEAGWDVAIASHVELLFVHMARSLRVEPFRRTSADARDRLRLVRLSIRRHPERHWTVTDMARRAALSRSRFSVVYKQVFGVSPMEDVIAVRLERARHMLATMTAPAISVGCSASEWGVHRGPIAAAHARCHARRRSTMSMLRQAGSVQCRQCFT